MGAEQLDSVIRVAEAIDTYGPLTIAFAVLLVICMMAVVFIMRRSQKTEKGEDAKYQALFAEFQAQNQKVFEKLMQAAFKSHPPELLPASITASGLVREQLKHTAAVTKADRVSVYAYHDGQRMVTGQHMYKISCWNEYTMLAKFVRIGVNKDIHVAKIQDIISVLMTESRWEALTEEDVNKSQFNTWENGDITIKSIFAHTIHSTDGVPLGFILMEYLQYPAAPAWIDGAREECKLLSDKVSIVLDVDTA